MNKDHLEMQLAGGGSSGRWGSIQLMFAAGVAAIVLLSLASVYSSYVAATNHRNSCTSRGLVLDTLNDVIRLALTPQPGQKLTAEQVSEITAFETAAARRIDQARCH